MIDVLSTVLRTREQVAHVRTVGLSEISKSPCCSSGIGSKGVRLAHCSTKLIALMTTPMAVDTDQLRVKAEKTRIPQTHGIAKSRAHLTHCRRSNIT
jgi:hypothetical protein